MYPGFQTVIFFLISGAFLNHEHGLFHLRYFENGLLVQGSMDKQYAGKVLQQYVS